MSEIKIINFQKLHQAYLLVGSKKYWQQILETEFKNFLKIDNLISSPDIWWQNYESFGIKDAHTLIEREAHHGFGEQGRFFVLEISSITSEAQNALLKTFEEPAPDAHFFIIARTVEIFLPTLRSRLVELRSEVSKSGTDAGKKQDEVVAADKFLKLDLPDRLDFIQKEFLKSKDKPKSKIIDFVIELEKTLRFKIDMSQITKDEELALREIEKCLHYFQNPRSSSRLILEHLSLIIPLN